MGQQFSSLSEFEKENSELRREMDALQTNMSRSTVDSTSFEARLKAETARAEEALERETKLRRELSNMRFLPRNGDSSEIYQEARNEIDTLQHEIERLRKELSVAKEGRQKDLELETLKLHIQTHFAELNQMRDQMRRAEGEVTEDDLTFGPRDTHEQNSADDIAAAENEGH